MPSNNFNFERWTPYDDEQLTSLFRQGASDDHIATTLHRSKSSVSQRRVKLRLLKREETVTCPKCGKLLTVADGLRTSEGCGYEAPVSAERPIRPPHESDDDKPLPERVHELVHEASQITSPAPRKETETVADIETIARENLQSVQQQITAHQERLDALNEEKAKLQRVLAALEPRPGFTCPECGRSFQAKNNLGGHMTVKHPGVAA